MPWFFAVITAEPLPFAVIFPLEVTVATPFLLERYVVLPDTPFKRSVFVCPTDNVSSVLLNPVFADTCEGTAKMAKNRNIQHKKLKNDLDFLFINLSPFHTIFHTIFCY